MLNLLIICLIAGGIGAILQGMVGIGTGIVVIPLLTFILPHYGIPQNIAIHIALATSMAAIVINSISALISHYKRGNVYWPLFKRIILFSISGAFLGALVASFIGGRYLQSIFGIFMLLLAIYMLMKKPATEQAETIPLVSIGPLAAGGISIGFCGSLIGSGGGVLMIPFLHALKLKMRYAVGTSTLIGLPVAIVGAITYIFAGITQVPSSLPTFGYLHWPAFLAISIAGILCAPLGTKLATVLPTKILQRLFAACMTVVGLKMLF